MKDLKYGLSGLGENYISNNRIDLAYRFSTQIVLLIFKNIFWCNGFITKIGDFTCGFTCAPVSVKTGTFDSHNGSNKLKKNEDYKLLVDD